MDMKLDIVVSLPADIDFLKIMSFTMVFSLAMLLISLLARFTLGKDSGLKTSITSALGIIMLYSICIVIYCFSPRDFSGYLNKLPIGGFTQNDGKKIFIFNSIQGLTLPELSYQILRIYLLSVMVTLLGRVNPKDMKTLGWVVVRIAMFGVAILLNYGLVRLIDTFTPVLFRGYAPLILLAILAFTVLFGFLKFLMGMLFQKPNAVYGTFFDFYAKNSIGKCLGCAVGSTVLVCALIIVFKKLGYGVIPISPEALYSYVPFAVCMFLLWLIIGRFI